MRRDYDDYDEGSFGGGFALGFFLGIIGLIIAFAIHKPQTTKGAGIGLLLGIVLEIILGCVILNYMMGLA